MPNYPRNTGPPAHAQLLYVRPNYRRPHRIASPAPIVHPAKSQDRTMRAAPMSEFDYDLFVIGGGSGGVRAARISAGYGAKVAIAEEYRFGGTCVIRGCVPKKLLVYASRFRDDFEDAAGFGWSVSPPSFDWPTLIANKDAEITRLEGLYRQGLERAGVAIMQARAELADAHTLSVQPGNRKVTARTVLVATGGRPVVPDVPGAGHAITSNEAFHLDALPKSILIV